MRTKIINVYSIGELSEDAQERAYHNWLQYADYPWNGENKGSLEAFCEVFPIVVTDWSYGGRDKHVSYHLRCADCDTEKAYYGFTGVRLLKWIVNNYWCFLFKPKYIGHLKGKEKFSPVYSKCQFDSCCVLTGYCIDDDLLQPIYDFLKGIDNYTTFNDLMKECLENWLSACHSDYEDCLTMEYFLDHAEANNYEYNKDGRMI